MTVEDLIRETFEDITILAPGQSLSATDANNGLSKLLRLFDDWNAEQSAVYANNLDTFTLVPALQPHTIGPAASSPTFTVTTARPVSIDGANLVLTNVTPNVYRGIKLVDSEAYRSLTVQGLSTDIPLWLYYNATWPLGEIFLWPIPTTAYGLQLQYRIVLADVTLSSTLTMPQGYRSAITLTLGEMLAPSYPPAVPQPEAAAKARARIFANNDVTPTLQTYDAGMPRISTKNKTTFNYKTGLFEP